MADPFAAHGIERLSPSSLTTFAAQPAMWVLERLLGQKQPVGAAAHRGTAMETGIVAGLMGKPDDEAIAEAEAQYRVLTAMCGDPKVADEGDALPAMIRQGLAELRPYGPPTATQGFVEHRVEGIEVPIVGYFDVEWSNHGIILDIKSTHRIPSAISTKHARQVGLYRLCRGDNQDARISYISTRKASTYRLENYRDHVVALERIAHAVRRFLAVSPDPQELAGIVVPDVDSFYWNDPAARTAAFTQWGL